MKFNKVARWKLFVVSFLVLVLLFFLTQPVIVAHKILPSHVAAGSAEIYIPEGQFLMGCTYDFYSGGCDNDTWPIHAVWLSAYYIDKTEVTNAQYRACVAAGVCAPPLSSASPTRSDYYTNPAYNDFPVINVLWTQARTYCFWQNKRLPTEAEWEKAARGTDLRIYPWGDQSPTCALARFAGCGDDTRPVGSFPAGASPYGVLNMAGNVSEWVNDFYSRYAYREGAYHNPQGPLEDGGKGPLVRGGSWHEGSGGITTFVRLDESEITYLQRIGFRCARDASVGPTSTPPPTATPTPTPTPVPADTGRFGEEGGLLWITHPEHLTAVRVLPETLTETMTSELALTVTYTQPRPVGNLHAMDHFFIVEGVQSTRPLEVLLGFKNSGGVIAGTQGLYRLDSTVWVTDTITTTERSSGHILAWIDQSGMYGILGQTNRVYLPLIFRR